MTYPYRYRRSLTSRIADNLPLLGSLLVVLAIVGIICLNIANSLHGPVYKTCTVLDTDRTRGSKGKSDMRVYTEQCGTLEVADSFLHSRYNSADLFGRLQKGQTYRMTVYGWRIPILSGFPNILEAEPVK